MAEFGKSISNSDRTVQHGFTFLDIVRLQTYASQHTDTSNSHGSNRFNQCNYLIHRAISRRAVYVNPVVASLQTNTKTARANYEFPQKGDQFE
jgi:hypothetical protein